MARLVVDIESGSRSDDEFPSIEELAGTRGKNVLAKVKGPVRGKAEKAVHKSLIGEEGEDSGVGGGDGGGVPKAGARKRVLKQTANNPLLRRFDGTSSELLGNGLRRKGRAVGLKDRKAAVGREEVVLEPDSCGGKKILVKIEDEGKMVEETKSSSKKLMKFIESDDDGVSQAREMKRQPKTAKGREITTVMDGETEEVKIHPKWRSITMQSNESEDEDISQVRKAKTRQISKKVNGKIKEDTTPEQDHSTPVESAENEDANQMRKTVKTRQSKKSTKKFESTSPPKVESDEEDFGLDTDGLSDFIVDDSTFLEEEDTIIEEPAPRSVRRLVKGRRQYRVEDSDDEESRKRMGKTKAEEDVSKTLEKALRELDLEDSEDEGETKSKITSKDIHSKVPRRGRDDKAPPASSDIDNPFTLR